MCLVLHEEVLLMLLEIGCVVALDIVDLRAEGILASHSGSFLLEEERFLGSVLDVLGRVLKVPKAHGPQVRLVIFLALAKSHETSLSRPKLVPCRVVMPSESRIVLACELLKVGVVSFAASVR